MRDFSSQLPTWTYQIGYRLQGGTGTYDVLELYKGLRLVKRWDWLDEVPSIMELEEIVREVES